MKRFAKLIFLIIVLFLTSEGFVFAKEPYTLSKGSLERKEILDALRQGLKHFPDDYSLDFKYQREDIKIKPGKIIFKVKYLKVLNQWAWIEAEVQDWCCANILALLYKENSKWTVKGMVNPHYVVCKDFTACIDVKAYLYKTFTEQFPSVAPELLPKVHPLRNAILVNAISDNDYYIFVVEHFKEKNGWAWVETSPRSMDGMNITEPLNALFKKEKGKWKLIESQPCCGEYEEHPGVKKYGGFISYLKHRYPQVPKEIFQK